MVGKFDVTGMTCSACSAHVEKSVSKLDGVHKVSVNLLTNSMQVEYDENTVGSDGIINAVISAGYGASDRNSTKPGTDTGKTDAGSTSSMNDVYKKNIENMKRRLIVSVIFLIPLMYVSMGHMFFSMAGLDMPEHMARYLSGDANAGAFAITQVFLLIPIVIANQKYYITGFKTLVKRSPNMDSLIAIGSGAAIVYGIYATYKIVYGLGYGDMETVHHFSHDLYFESAGMILTLITVGKYLETRSKSKTSEAITKLMDLAPKTATVIRDGIEQVISADEMAVGDIFIVKPGEAVAVDGIVVDGKSSVDESAVTGESIPVIKQEGDRLVSASINKAGLLKVKALKVGEDTTLSQIIKLVEEASSSKAPIAKIADKVSGIFVPSVITIAVITAAIWLLSGYGFEFALSTAIAVLVISCPCALGLATPVAIMAGTGKGAENGILVKSGEALETAHLIDTVVLDKTGTITEGKPVATDIMVFGNMTETELLRIAGTLENGSGHPLAEAVINKCKAMGISFSEVKEFEAVFGKGITGIVDGIKYYAGNKALLEEYGIPADKDIIKIADNYASHGKTPLIFADKNSVRGIIAVADVVKKSSRAAVEEFKKQGIHVVMLTGDNETTANAIKEETGIDEVIANVLPAQKEEKISSLKAGGHKVAMVGDGVNDAPALASADVGIAIGAGTDIAIESADIVLMRNSLMDAVGAVKLSRAVIRNIKENLFWAFFYNIIGIPVAAGILYLPFGIKLSPMLGAAAMSLSSVCVVSNALRLKRLKLFKENNIFKESSAFLKNTGNITRKEDIVMTKKIIIEGMMCEHCTGRVEKALRAVAGVTDVVMDLEGKSATVTADNAGDDVLKMAVTDAGYEVVSIE
ncbi:MAG TPA: heavy metal translocating P-type ATPase [Lachnospiraceae bacterium]|nr:heavy metal translocating P-type ATPase [Lachnospiraceae bacterium]